MQQVRIVRALRWPVFHDTLCVHMRSPQRHENLVTETDYRRFYGTAKKYYQQRQPKRSHVLVEGDGG